VAVMRSEAKHNRRLPHAPHLLRDDGVKRLPLLPRPYFPGRRSHVVPVALGEVSKLCGVAQGEVPADTEAVPSLGPWPVLITDTPDHHPDAVGLAIAVLLGELNQSHRILLGRVLDLCLELVGPAKEVVRGSESADPRDMAAGELSHHSFDVLVRFRDIARNGDYQRSS